MHKLQSIIRLVQSQVRCLTHKNSYMPLYFTNKTIMFSINNNISFNRNKSIYKPYKMTNEAYI